MNLIKTSDILFSMKILGIETSCDETAIAVLSIETFKPLNIKVLSNVVSSQVKLHAKYGGVVPHLAAREHEKNLPRVLRLALQKAGIKSIKSEISFIAVTIGPGLSPALWQGVNFAKELAKKYKKPIIGVNHLEAHIYSNWLNNKKIPFPALNLIVSGGHTMLVLMKSYGKYKIIGETLDDAAGEAFDKVARILGLGYPGGPAISQKAEKWNFKIPILNFKKNNKNQAIKFPRPMINSKDYNFSYSGLKTAVLYKIKELKNKKIKLTESLINQICYEFQRAAIEVLIVKTVKAAKDLKVKSILLSGGVSANKLLRHKLKKETEKLGVYYAQPEMKYTTDNAVMIALAGFFSRKKTSIKKLAANPNLTFV